MHIINNLSKVCRQCLRQEPPDITMYDLGIMSDDQVLKIECKFGHIEYTIVNQLKFEILSEFAVCAIVDGYYREAVMSFASSLERLHEYYISIICKTLKINEIGFVESWKDIKNQSERQLGAFKFVFLLEEKISSAGLSNNKIEFRNKVVHKGFFPERAEAIDFGQSVADITTTIISKLKAEKHEAAVREYFNIQKAEAAKKFSDAELMSGYSIETAFSMREFSGNIDIKKIVSQRTLAS